MKHLSKISKIGIIGLFILTGMSGKGLLTAERFSLPDFSFPKISQIFEEEVITANDFDPRDTNGRRPLNLEEAKNNLRQIFYSGLAEALKNRNLPIITETLRQIEKILDLTSKVIRLPLTTRHLPLTLAIPPTLKDFLEKLIRLISRASTLIPLSPYPLITYSLYTLHFTLYTFFSLLFLSKIVLRL